MQRAFNLMLCAAAMLVMSVAGAAAETRVALVIGNGAYAHATGLKNPSGDAAAISAVLKTLDFTVVEGRDLTRAAFEDKLRAFSALLPTADVALVFYAGHGLQIDGGNWLVPIDADLHNEMDLELGAIQLATLLSAMERGPRVRLIFLDACRDNPIATQLAQGLGNRSGNVGRGLARVEAGVGTLIAYSTQPGAVAADGTGAHSPFADALLSTIGAPGLDVRQMLTRVRARVIEQTDQAQVPWDHSSLVGNFYFKPGAAEQTQVAALGPSTDPQPSDNGACKRAQSVARQVQVWDARADVQALARDAESCFATSSGSATAYYLRGVARAERGDALNALEDLDRAIALNDEYVDAYVARARVYGQRDGWRGVKDLKRAQELDAANASIYLARGHLEILNEHSADADQAFQRALQLEPKLAAGYVGRALTWIHGSPDRRDRDPARGLAYIEQALELDKQDAFAYAARGWANYALGKGAQGEADFVKAQQIAPNNADIIGQHGAALAGAGDCRQAVPYLTRAISLGVYDAFIYWTRSGCHFENQNNDAGIADLETFIDISRGNETQVAVARGAIALAKKDFQALVEVSSEALARQVGLEVFFLIQRALGYSQLGRPEMARADLERALTLSKDDAFWNDEVKKSLAQLNQSFPEKKRAN